MSAELVLAENGRSAYQIVLSDNASPSTRHGAEELQTFLAQMTRVKLPIVSDSRPQGPKEIILGDNTHLRRLGVTIDFAALGNEGYVIRTVGEHLVIVGGPLRGNMYGVYGFLEDHLGCHWFAPGVSRIPKSAAVGHRPAQRPPGARAGVPRAVFGRLSGWRLVHRNRMNSSAAPLDDEHGGKVRFADGLFVHTFSHLVPPQKYFKDHPEYFSLVKGRRMNGYAQLCCTNPEVIRICTEAIRTAMRQQPQATVFSVSQNDCDLHCECPRCQALASREGSQMAPVLQLVNCVAEAVEQEFPDKIVETLAYQWTRRAPMHMRPRPNVVVRLCSIECCFSHPLATCDSAASKAFRGDMEAWSKVASRLWVWDYATDFAHYLLPFPNQRVRGPNVRYFVEHNVKGIFEEDTNQTADSELAALGGYVMAKCLWNPSYDTKRAIGEFLEAYYGKAAAPIRAYIDLLHDRVERENIHVHIYAGIDSPHLNDELLTTAETLWQQAKDLVAGEPEVLRRVRLSRMSVDYAVLERARLQARKKLPASASLAKLATARFQPFFEVLQSGNLSHLREGQTLDKAAYRRGLAKDLGI